MKSRMIYSALRIVILSVISVIIIYPLLWMVSIALKDTTDMYSRPWGLIPKTMYWSNFSNAWEVGQIGSALVNTLYVTIVSILILLVVCYLGAYALARIPFRGRRLFQVLFLSTMLLPVQIILIPLYKILQFLHLLDTRWGLIVPYVAGALPISIILMSAFLKSIPFELEESAEMDGANRLQLIYRIMLPLSRPGLATVIILQFLNYWNDFALALTVINNPDIRTITLALLNFKGQWGMMDFNKLFAALAITSTPVILIFVIFQRQFISGLTSGALKA